MASTRIRRPDPCTYENCGSRKFHVGDDGYTYCDQGHQQSERGTVVADDTGELVIPGVKSRKKDSDVESTTSKASAFGGARAFEHYLLCFQLVLRKQLRWLVEVQKLPEELESLVRDIWALRLQKLRTRILNEPDKESDVQSSQAFSSQSEIESSTGSQSQSSQRSRTIQTGPREATPNLGETLSLCYIGTLLLRIPVTVGDIHKWTNEGELLYYRASREIPLGMRARLPGLYQELLEPQELIQAQTMQQNIMDILMMLEVDFGMAAPPVNTPLLLYRWIQDLALPLEVFTATQRLARVLNVDGAFTKGGSNIVLRYPEVQLMALVIIATKLLLPFDEIERYPESATDLAAVSMNWDEWVKSHQRDDNHTLDRSQLSFERAFNFAEADCIEAADETLDAYLDWYNTNIASEEVRTRGQAGRDADFRRALFKIFPVQSETHTRMKRKSTVTGGEVEAKLRHIQSTLVPNAAVGQRQASNDTPRPGTCYRRFRQVQDLSGPAKIFFEEAAKLAGSSLEGLVQAVFLTERKVQKHEDALRKAGRAR